LARAETNLSACGLAVKRFDRDRWFCALFAAQDRREDLYALYAFNAELARVAEKVSEPLLGEIRLQWWREAIEGLYAGTPRRHDVVEALAVAIPRHGLERSLFERLIDARARDLETAPPADLVAMETYARETSVPLMRLALDVLGVRSEAANAAAESGATGHALVGLMRAAPHFLAEGRVMLPADKKTPEALNEAARPVAERARERLEEARRLASRLPREAVPALLPVALARSDLRRLTRLKGDIFDPRFAERRGGRLLDASLRALLGRL
jgi:phytoene synthase